MASAVSSQVHSPLSSKVSEPSVPYSSLYKKAIESQNLGMIKRYLDSGFAVDSNTLQCAIESEFFGGALLIFLALKGLELKDCLKFPLLGEVCEALTKVEKKKEEWETAYALAEGASLAHLRVKQNRLDELKAMKSLDCAVQDKKGLTPLHYAILSQNKRAVEILKEKISGADLKEGETYLHVAASVGNVEILEILENAGVDRLQVNYEGFLPAHFAALLKDSDEVLLYFKEDLQVQTKSHVFPACLFVAQFFDRVSESLFSAQDKQLLVANIAYLALAKGWNWLKNSDHFVLDPMGDKAYLGIDWFTYLLRQKIISTLPSSGQNLKRFTSVYSTIFLDLFYTSGLSQAARLISVANHTFQTVISCSQRESRVFSKEKMLIPVHLLNFLLTVWSSRLTEESLNEKRLRHLKNEFSLFSGVSKGRFPKIDVQLAETDHSYRKRAYRSYTSLMHPDRCPIQNSLDKEKCDEAFNELVSIFNSMKNLEESPVEHWSWNFSSIIQNWGQWFSFKAKNPTHSFIKELILKA